VTERPDIEAYEALLAAATPGPYRLLTRTGYDADARISENGCSVVAELGALGADGQSCWVLVDDSLRTPRLGPYAWGALFAAAPTTLRELLTYTRALEQERDRLIATYESDGNPSGVMIEGIDYPCSEALMEAVGRLVERLQGERDAAQARNTGGSNG
jgi:hypothetical protein